MADQIGFITKPQAGPVMAKFRCSRGHEFEDRHPGSAEQQTRIFQLYPPDRFAGAYCVRCIEEFLKDHIGTVQST